jgi:hypothetical protein
MEYIMVMNPIDIDLIRVVLSVLSLYIDRIIITVGITKDISEGAYYKSISDLITILSPGLIIATIMIMTS